MGNNGLRSEAIVERPPVAREPSPDDCLGLPLARAAQALPDLLFASPGEWLDRPMLRHRLVDGSWRQLTRAEQTRYASEVAWVAWYYPDRGQIARAFNFLAT